VERSVISTRAVVPFCSTLRISCGTRDRCAYPYQLSGRGKPRDKKGTWAGRVDHYVQTGDCGEDGYLPWSVFHHLALF
jgi:hypothetical protein